MPHPQSSPRGLFAKKGVIFGNSTSTVTANSTGAIFAGSVFVSGQGTFGKLSANSTALILPNSVRVGTKTTYFSSNTTGVKLGSLYISANSTGNTTT